MLNIYQDGSILWVQLNRPNIRNAFNEDLIKALSSVFGKVDPKIRVIILSGEGPSFCAGGDLEWMKRCANYNYEQNLNDALNLALMFELMNHCRVPIIAKVHGAAFGGGCGLVAASDIAIAEQDTKFAFSEVRLGLVPATISSTVISKIGVGHARSLFVTGEIFDATRAFQIGLVHAVVEPSQMDHQVDQKIKSILSAGPKAVEKAKLLAQSITIKPEDSANYLAEARANFEGREGVRAFLEKRKAEFVENR